MEHQDNFANLPEPIVIQPVDPTFCVRLDEDADTEGSSDAVETDTRDDYSVAAETAMGNAYPVAVETETGMCDAYSVMLDHAYAAVQITGMKCALSSKNKSFAQKNKFTSETSLQQFAFEPKLYQK